MKNLTPKFIALTFLLSWTIHIPFALKAQKIIAFNAPTFIVWLAGLVPAVVAYLLVKRDKTRLDALKNSIVKVKVPIITLLVCILLPVLCLAVAYVANPQIKLFLSPLIAVFTVVWFILAYGEEIGWRGLALPELSERFNPFVAATIVGLFWCIWHYPKGLSNYYIKDWPSALQGMGMFSVQILLANYILAWLYLKSNRSVFITSLFHGLFNVMATIYFRMAMDVYVTSTLALVAFGVIYWDRNIFFKPHSMNPLHAIPNHTSTTS